MDKNVEDYLGRFPVGEGTLRFLNQEQRMLVGDQWVYAADRDRDDVQEFSTGGVVTQIPRGTSLDIDLAVEAARKQVDGGTWSQLMPLERENFIRKLADLMESHAQELAEIESVDTGKSVSLAKAVDIKGSIDVFRYFAGWASKIDGRSTEPCALEGKYVAYTRREAIGVVGIILPWNFPLQTLSWKLAVTLATGCSAVIKPSEL
ncbi:MAG: aldehyde dehydrogenase family protein, partial [Alcanivoracaceae bacterium]|nr:aldehyde dehydrogenase family protein [Alcanivoracaceae bacterium]